MHWEVVDGAILKLTKQELETVYRAITRALTIPDTHFRRNRPGTREELERIEQKFKQLLSEVNHE